MIFMSVLMGYLLDTHLRLSLIPSLRIGINASLLKGNEPQTTQLGGADLATSPVGGLKCPPTPPKKSSRFLPPPSLGSLM